MFKSYFKTVAKFFQLQLHSTFYLYCWYWCRCATLPVLNPKLLSILPATWIVKPSHQPVSTLNAHLDFFLEERVANKYGCQLFLSTQLRMSQKVPDPKFKHQGSQSSPCLIDFYYVALSTKCPHLKAHVKVLRHVVKALYSICW